MFNLFGYTPCTHPLNNLAPIGCVDKELILPAKTHYRNTIRFHCTKCDGHLTRSWDSMTPEMWNRVKNHSKDIEESIMFGKEK